MLLQQAIGGLLSLAIFVQGSRSPQSLTPSSQKLEENSTTTIAYEAFFDSTSQTCQKTIETVRQGLKKGDRISVYNSVKSFHTLILKIQIQIESFDSDSHLAVKFSASVAEVVSSYSTVVFIIREHPSVEKGCHGKLKEIKVTLQKIIHTYTQMGISIKAEIEKKDEIDLNRLKTLDLGLDLSFLENVNENVKIEEEEDEEEDDDDVKDKDVVNHQAESSKGVHQSDKQKKIDHKKIDKSK